jgi:hypothetical protein
VTVGLQHWFDEGLVGSWRPRAWLDEDIGAELGMGALLKGQHTIPGMGVRCHQELEAVLPQVQHLPFFHRERLSDSKIGDVGDSTDRAAYWLSMRCQT